MYYSGIEPCDALNGYGFRTTLWVSGCSFGCRGCFNPNTHNPYYGKEFTKDTMNYLIKCLSNPQIQGLTLSGGNPTESYNLPQIDDIINNVRKLLPTKDIWIYSPYTWSEIYNNKQLRKVIQKCDVLVDGKYIEELRDISLKFRGSSNQRLININKSKKNKIILFDT